MNSILDDSIATSEPVQGAVVHASLTRTQRAFPGDSTGSARALSRMERALWNYLVSHAGRAVSREELLLRVWGLDPRFTATRTVDMHVAKLRRKLGRDSGRAQWVRTVRGTGYAYNES